MGRFKGTANPHGDGDDEAMVEDAVAVDSDTFDPGDHKVDDVLAFVEANPDQRDRIFDAEQAGKGRTSLLTAL